jgi:Fur family zinc uptake transcriptional regulator
MERRLKVAIVLLHCNNTTDPVFCVRQSAGLQSLTHATHVTDMPQPVFHAPDHDHERCTADALAHAELLCSQRSQRLTPIRRQVLEVLLESHKPLGAYEIMDRAAARGGRPAPSGGKPAPSGGNPAPSGGKLAPNGGRPAPITIYRALDFLRDNGLVHRIESRNAFVACVNNHATGDLVVFLICEHCGAVGEAASAAVADQLKAAARAAGFTPQAPVIEIGGVCAHCRTHEHS